MSRELVWIEQRQGWGCSACAWVFHSSEDLPAGALEGLMRSFEVERDREFMLHVCADHPDAQTPKEQKR